PSPMVFCTSRLTTSTSGGAPSAWAVLYSKSIDRSICGSPKTLPKVKASSAAKTPTSIPRMRNERIMLSSPRSVAGEAEQVATVVHELVDEVARDDRGGAFLGADEVVEQQEHQPTEDGVGKPLTHRDGDRLGFDLRYCDCGHGAHAPGISRPSRRFL